MLRGLRLKTPLTQSVVDAADISKNNSGADLPYLLQQTPSLVVSSDAGTGIGYTSLRIRGSDITRINVTMNGVPVNDPESHGVFFCLIYLISHPQLIISIFSVVWALPQMVLLHLAPAST